MTDTDLTRRKPERTALHLDEQSVLHTHQLILPSALRALHKHHHIRLSALLSSRRAHNVVLGSGAAIVSMHTIGSMFLGHEWHSIVANKCQTRVEG